MIDLTGKTALVTGGSRGIGRAIALRLATQGADVAFTYKGNADAAAETTRAIEALGRRALAVQGDASQAETADSVVKTVLEAFGKVDILVNNAGVTRDDLIMRMSVEAWREVLETNLYRRLLHDQGRHPPDAQGEGRPDHQHHVGLGTGRPDGPGQLFVGQGRADRADQGVRPRAGEPLDHGQRGRPGVRAHRADPGPARRAQGRAHGPHAARAVRRDRRRSPTPSRSSPATRRPSSPGRSSPSTAAW